MVPKPNRRVLTVLTLALINVAAVMNLGQLSVLAEYGLAAIFFVALAALVFFIPVSLTSAELATGWPKTGGVYAWVKEAFGQRMGFLAIWLQWIENVIWYPTILSFIAATIAFIFNPELASNTLYTLAVILIIAWGVTLLNFRGMKLSGQISSFGAVAGMMFPAALVILLGIIWLLTGSPVQIDLSPQAMIPDLSSFASIVFFAGVILSLAGMEMSAVHAQEVENPQRDYPRAILLSAVVILAVFTLGSLAIAMVVPQSEIVLTAGIMEAFTAFFTAYNIQWLIPFMALLIGVGSIGMVSTWIVGPSKGLLATANDGDLPPFFQKTNKEGMPVNLLITQAAIITLLALVFVFMPNVSSSYWILTALTVQLYLLMYILMFAAAIKLRYSKPNVKRAYTIPGGKLGIWLVAGIGILGAIFAFGIGFIPPAQISTGSTTFFHAFMIAGIVLTCIVPFIVRHFRKPSWAPSKR